MKQNRHGLSGTRIYNIFRNMKQRCYNPNDPKYSSYGGRGITIYQSWLDDFRKFYEWSMANGYSDELTIDRIDGTKGYSPDNCRWVTWEEQWETTGRPTESLKSKQFSVRFDEETLGILDSYCKENSVSRPEGVRAAVRKLKEKE